MANKKKSEKIVDAVIEEKKSKRKKEEFVETEIVENTETTEKPYFFPRLVAYIIDVLLVSIVCTGILFLVPENKNYDKYMKEYEQIQTDYIEEKITTDEYLNKSVDVVYDIDYSNVVPMIIETVLLILYFIVFQFYNKGQTFGKKLMKLRLVSVKDELTVNNVAFHALIVNAIFINILIIAALLFVGKDYYYYTSLALQVVSMLITFSILIMILFRKDGRGLHDVVAGTKVIQE